MERMGPAREATEADKFTTDQSYRHQIRHHFSPPLPMQWHHHPRILSGRRSSTH